MVTALGEAVWAAGLAIRDTEFGSMLRNARSSQRRPDGSVTALVPEPLMGWETSFDPALQRTMAAVVSMDMIGTPVPREAGTWVLWVASAMEAMQCVVAKCWTGVPVDIRRAFLDLDDVRAPGTESYIANLRLGDASSSLGFAGLDSRPVRRALARVYALVEKTPSAASARGAARILQRRQDLMRVLIIMRERIGFGLLLNRPGDTISKALERTRAEIAGAYGSNSELAGLVNAFRAHNRLVTRIVWMLLGVAEQFEPAVVTETVGAISDRVVDGERHIDLTVRSQHFALLRPTHPVLIQMSIPVDGLYFLSRHTVTLGAIEEDDLGLVAFG